MRGKVLPMQISWRKTGITPAYAGKSEKKKLDLLKQQGSPPPMRGKEAVQMRLGHKDRITPAYAGKSSKSVTTCPMSAGSPPPMRGKVVAALSLYQVPGITPAYAGKRRIEDVGAACRRDHPRLCGEKTKAPGEHELKRGSPPPMRGKAGV